MSPDDTAQIRVGAVWRSLIAGEPVARVSESDTLSLRGFVRDEVIFLGPVALRADVHGRVEQRLSEHESLTGHLGLVEVRRSSGRFEGEFEIVPDKLSEDACEALRASLEQVWPGLVFDPDGTGRLRGELPSPLKLWRSIESAVREIAAQPRWVLDRSDGLRRLESVRRPSELTASVVRAGAVHRPGRSRVLVRSSKTPENALVSATLTRLASYARRQPDGEEVAARASRMLRQEPYASCRGFLGSVDSTRLRTLHDARYRRVDQVLRVLDLPEAHAIEGPGEARLGTKGMIRLYEYWVFLRVLEACRNRYGAPLDNGFDILARKGRASTIRLSIPEGAEVRFPGDVTAAFEPSISASGRGWQQLENVPHPRRDLAQHTITPDVVVLRGGSQPSAVIFDAKYVGRHWVETAAAEIHARYSRIRLDGQPVVRFVHAAHPHHGIDHQWAGYGSLPLIPGEDRDLASLLP